MYNKTVMDRFQSPKNAGSLRGANAIGQVGSSSCGDIMKMYFKINEETLVVEESKFKTFGCCASIACTDVACDLVKGKSLEEILKINSKQIAEVLGDLPENKVHSTVLAEETIKAGVEDYFKRKERAAKRAAMLAEEMNSEQEEQE